MATTTTTQIPAEVNNWYDKLLLIRAIPRFIHTAWAQVRPLPSNSGTKVIKFRRYSNLSPATTALTEGTTPTGSQLASTEITATLAQYGDFVEVSDVLSFTSQDAMLAQSMELLGTQAGDTIDQLTRDVLAAGTSVSYGGNATSRAAVDSTDLIDANVIKQAVRGLDNNKARRITSMINASTGTSTTPVNNSYIGIVHPSTGFTLKDLTGFTPVEKYSSTLTAMEGEIGKLGDVRFVETTNSKVFAGAGAAGIDVYATIILGKDAYGISQISGQSMESIRKDFGTNGNDPLNQRATSGWKATFVAKILNDNFMTRVEHAIAA